MYKRQDVTGALQRRGSRAVLELLHQAGVFAEGAVAHLTDDIETVVPVSLFQQELQHVLIERACHALVCRQYQIGAAGIAVLSPVSYTHLHLPVIVDPSHACGHAWMVPQLAKAAVAAGADGLMIEVHNDPAKAKCDGAQSLTPDQFDELMGFIRKEVEFFGKKMN